MNTRKREGDEMNGCPFNSGLICEIPNKCYSCGWNPKVDAIRREMLKRLFSRPAPAKGYIRHLKLKYKISGGGTDG
jgi:hypothetical protein